MSWIEDIPIKDSGFGKVSDDTRKALDQVEELLSHRGTLQADTIDLEALAAASRRVLRDAAHVQGFRGAVYAAATKGDAEGFECALRLGLRFLGDTWAEMHPTAKKAARLKSAAAKDIHDILARAARSLPGEAFDPTDAHAQLLAELHTACTESGQFEAAPFEPVETPAGGKASQVSAQSDALAPSTSLDARARAELRQDILRLAERISGFEPEAGLAAQMRGYAAWMEHRDLPEHDKNGETVQSSLPRKLRDDLLAAVQSPSIVGLARLEERLVHSPDWFEGQYAAAQVAAALGFGAVERAIRGRVQGRLEALKGLKELTYPNGEAFVPEEVLTWASPTPASAASPLTSADPNDLNFADTDAAELMAALNTYLRAAPSIRAKALARFALARHLIGLDQQQAALALLDGVIAQTETLSIAEWDAPFVGQLHEIADGSM